MSEELQGVKADTLTYNDVLRDIFNQTETVSLMHETLLKPELLVNTGGEDCYLVSQFGLMDAILDEKLGFIPKREEGELILMGKKLLQGQSY